MVPIINSPSEKSQTRSNLRKLSVAHKISNEATEIKKKAIFSSIPLNGNNMYPLKEKENSVRNKQSIWMISVIGIKCVK